MITKKPTKFQKYQVYTLFQKKKSRRMACILVDKTMACLVPISGHKKDQGYSLKLDQAEIWYTDMSMHDIEIEKYGWFEPGGEYIAYETI